MVASIVKERKDFVLTLEVCQTCDAFPQSLVDSSFIILRSIDYALDGLCIIITFTLHTSCCYTSSGIASHALHFSNHNHK